MKLPAAAYSAEVAASATKAGSYGVFGEGEHIISHQNLQSKSLQPIYLSRYLKVIAKSARIHPHGRHKPSLRPSRPDRDHQHQHRCWN